MEIAASDGYPVAIGRFSHRTQCENELWNGPRAQYSRGGLQVTVHVDIAATQKGMIVAFEWYAIDLQRPLSDVVEVQLGGTRTLKYRAFGGWFPASTDQ